MTINLMEKPVVSVNEACMILGLSNSSIKRRIADGRIKTLDRINPNEKILIYTDSIVQYLSKGDLV